MGMLAPLSLARLIASREQYLAVGALAEIGRYLCCSVYRVKVAISAYAGFLRPCGGAADLRERRRVFVSSLARLTRRAREAAQAELVRERVDEERLRIAQDVHDVVGHGLAAIKMQADIALHLLARRPEQAEQALTRISRTSSEALDEVRATLATIRGTAPGAGCAPTLGLHLVDTLRERMTEAGMEVDVETRGAPREFDPAAELAAYRIVQESLTNALRHGAHKLARVYIGYDADAVALEITNPASGVDHPDGFGIPGMAERATMLGGEFTARRTADGHFAVRASIPYQPRR